MFNVFTCSRIFYSFVYSILGSRADEDSRKGRSNRREDPRRHTLSGDHHSAATAAAAFNYQNNIALERSLDLEVRNASKILK